jgi:RimJ/RimL family protein N-acetyltransferase
MIGSVTHPASHRVAHQAKPGMPECRDLTLLFLPSRSWELTAETGDCCCSLGLLPGRARDRLPAMTELGPVAWPPAPIKTERLVLRGPEARDRSALIELFTSPEVGTYIGGPQPRHEFERAVAEVPVWRLGLFVVDLDGAMIGFVTLLDRRDAGRPGHVRPEAGEAELGYMFLPQAWGHGYAKEACVAAHARRGIVTAREAPVCPARSCTTPSEPLTP